MQNVLQIKTQASSFQVQTGRYAKCIEVSKRIRWEIDRDVLRGRRFDFARKFLPDGLSKVNTLQFLSEGEQRLLSHIQGRTYANMFALVERFIGAKILETSRAHWLGDQTALEALVRFTDEELKHQELFRRIEAMIAAVMPEGYRFDHDADEVARVVLGKSTWSVLALTCLIELLSQAHYRESIAPDDDLCEVYKDVFLFHWKEESQHAILDELEWRREDSELSDKERDDAVTDLIGLAGAVDGIVQAQTAADVDFFFNLCGRAMRPEQIAQVRATVLYAYRWQYIISGVQDTRFQSILGSMISERQDDRLTKALTPIVASMV
jgi:hypothetical protein